MFHLRSAVRSKVAQTALALVALGASGGALKAQNNEVGPPAVFSVANIVLGETLRVNIVNLGDSTVPPGPCDVQVNFVNTGGVTVKSSQININVGQVGWATINFLEASQATNGATVAPRQVLRPVISLIPPGPCRVVMSAEVYENITGRTSQYILPMFVPAVQGSTVPAQ